MPRNITVTFSDGSSHVYRNAPDNLTPDQVSARAQKDFGKQVTALDGGRGQAANPRSQPAKGKVDPAKALQIYNNARASLAKQFANDPAKRKIALARFDNDPRMQTVRKNAGLTPVRTRQEEIKAVARRNIESTKGRAKDNMDLTILRSLPIVGSAMSLLSPEQAGAVAAGVENTFGIGTRIRAGIDFIGDKISGRDGNFSNSFQILNEENRQRRARAPGAGLGGELVGGILAGSAASKLATAGASKLASAGAPILQKTGNILQKLVTLKKGQRVRNTLKVSAGGAAGGGAQALGEGSDVGEGAAVGAVAAPVLGGAIKTVRGGARLLRQGTRPFSKSVSKAIGEIVSEAPDDLAARHAALSGQVGTNVPIVAALKDTDFKAVADKVLKRSPEATEIAKNHTGRYLRGFMDRMLSHVNKAGREGNAQITSIGELAQLRKDTADDLMKPIAGRMLDLTQLPLDDLERQVTRQIGGRIQGLAPRINEALRDLAPDDLAGMGLDASDVAAARRLMTQWGMGKPVTASVQEMDSLRRALDAAARSSQNSNPANAMAFRNAAKAVRDFTTKEVPAYGQMVDTYAAQSRMMEGFETAASGKRIGDIEDDLLRSNLRTPEGRIGMKAGELFRQREAVTGRTTGAISAARDFASEGKLTRPASLDPGAAQPGTVTENLGDRAAAGLARASQGETQVLGRMLDTDKLNALARNEGGALSPEEIAYGAFLGNALASTKARFLASLLNKLPHGFNKKVANNMADMLFSQDAAQSAKALAALNRVGIAERAVSSLMSDALPASFAAGAFFGGEGEGEVDDRPSGGEAPSVEGDLAGADGPSVENDLAGMETPGGEENPVDGDSPYADNLQEIYDTESPELLDLISRVETQESGGQQFDADGRPITSSAGAIGVMQVMPDTAPEAAALAGLPWDPQAYRNDPTYNRLLGIAYLSELLRRYDGDVSLALAAYNAGPARVDEALASNERNWLALLPAETQDYVERLS